MTVDGPTVRADDHIGGVTEFGVSVVGVIPGRELLVVGFDPLIHRGPSSAVGPVVARGINNVGNETSLEKGMFASHAEREHGTEAEAGTQAEGEEGSNHLRFSENQRDGTLSRSMTA